MTCMARQIAEVYDYAGFIAACRARMNELGIGVSSESAAEISGLHNDHLAKIMSQQEGRWFTPMTLGPCLGLLSMRLVLVEDLDALKRLNRRLKKRSDSHVRSGRVEFSIDKAKLAENRSKGGKNSRKGMTSTQASRIARKANLVRHAGGRAAKRSEAARWAALCRWRKHAAKRDETT